MVERAGDCMAGSGCDVAASSRGNGDLLFKSAVCGGGGLEDRGATTDLGHRGVGSGVRLGGGRVALCDIRFRRWDRDLDLGCVPPWLAKVHLAVGDRGRDRRVALSSVRDGTAERFAVRKISCRADDPRFHSRGLLAAFDSAVSEAAARHHHAAAACLSAAQLFSRAGIFLRLRGVLLALAARRAAFSRAGRGSSCVYSGGEHSDLHVPEINVSMERSWMAWISGRAVCSVVVGCSGRYGSGRETRNSGIAIASARSVGVRADRVRRYCWRAGKYADQLRGTAWSGYAGVARGVSVGGSECAARCGGAAER